MTDNSESVARILNSLPKRTESELGYDALADALYWSDELPEEVIDGELDFGMLQKVLRFRMTLILAEPDEELRDVWENALSVFPNWPGFSPERLTPNPDLAERFWHFHNRAIDAFRSIPD